MQKTFREVVEEQIPMKSLIAILAVIALFASYGLWITLGTGTLMIDSPTYGSQVFVDQHLAGTPTDTPDSIRLSLSEGKHNIIVSKEGYWPWTQDVEIKKHEITKLHPFIIPQKAPLESVSRYLSSNDTTNIDPNYTQTLSLFENLAISDEIKPLVEATHIQGVVYADYLPERSDAILVATKDGIFAVGVEKNEHPNFQPVYKAPNALFVKEKNNTLYIKDGDSIFHVKNLGL